MSAFHIIHWSTAWSNITNSNNIIVVWKKRTIEDNDGREDVSSDCDLKRQLEMRGEECDLKIEEERDILLLIGKTTGVDRIC